MNLGEIKAEMVRTYTRTTTRGDYGSDGLASVLQALKDGAPLIRVSREYNIPARTLRRHRDQAVSAPGKSMLGRHRVVLTPEIEEELKNHIKFMEKSLYGLTTVDVRRLAYDVADLAGIEHPFNKERRMAGEAWLSGFFSRHTDLAVRRTQGTNLSRAVGFNKAKVDEFFTLYGEVLGAHAFTPSRM